MAKKPQNTAGNRNEDSAPQERKWPDKAIIRYIIRALVLLIVFAWALVNLDKLALFILRSREKSMRSVVMFIER